MLPSGFLGTIGLTMIEKEDIPAIPNQVYEEWISWGEFLGTGYIATQNREFASFEEAKSFIHALKITKSQQWKEYCRSGQKPENIPSHPHVIYKHKWQGWGDWFGTGTVATYKRTYKPFTDAREFVRGKKFKNQQAWFDYCGSGKRPDDVPANPHKVYKKEWKGMGDWLGVSNRVLKNQQKSFVDAKEFVQSLGFKNQQEWRDYCKSGKKPKDIPSGVVVSYRKEWKGWGDFLGTRTNSPVRPQNARSFDRARKYIRNLKIKGCKDWLIYCRSGAKPNDIPANPQNVYKKEWHGWSDWLGKEPSGSEKRQYREFSDAKEFVKKLGLRTVKEWQKYAKTKRPKDIPSHPNVNYKEEWKNWADWLGAK